MSHSPLVARAMAVLLVTVTSGCAAGGPTGPTPSKAPATSATKPVSLVIDLAQLPKGDEPKTGWIAGDLHLDGKTFPLPGNNGDVAVLGDRLVTSGYDPTTATSAVQIRDGRTGKVISSFANASSRLVTNHRRNVVAWADEGGTIWVLQDGEDKPVDLTHPSPGGSKNVVAVTGNDCLKGPEEVEGAGCSVYFTAIKDSERPDQTAAMVASSHGFTDQASEKITDLIDVSPTKALVGLARIGEQKVCSRYEAGDSHYEQCDFLPTAFSPDGSRLLTVSSQIAEGPMTDEISVRDAATGKPQLTVRSPKGTSTIFSSVWEDDTHVLASIVQGETSTAIVRIGLDGKAELAVGPRDAAGEGPPLSFAVQP